MSIPAVLCNIVGFNSRNKLSINVPLRTENLVGKVI